MALSYRRTFIDVELLDKGRPRSLSCPPPAIGLEMCEKTFCENEANYVAQVKDLHHRIFFEEALRGEVEWGARVKRMGKTGGFNNLRLQRHLYPFSEDAPSFPILKNTSEITNLAVTCNMSLK